MITALATQAQTGNHLYPSSTGNDANSTLSPPCLQATPCKSASGAIGHVNPGATIIVLDSEGSGGRRSLIDATAFRIVSKERAQLDKIHFGATGSRERDQLPS